MQYIDEAQQLQYDATSLRITERMPLDSPIFTPDYNSEVTKQTMQTIIKVQ